MKTKSLSVGSSKTGSSKPSFANLKELFIGGDNHDANSDVANKQGKQNGKDTNSMVSDGRSPNVPGPIVNYSPSKKPNIPAIDTQKNVESSKNIQSSSKDYSSQFPETSYTPYSNVPKIGDTPGSKPFSSMNSLNKETAPNITGEAKNGQLGKSLYNQSPPGPQKEFGDKLSEGAIQKNSSVYDSVPNPIGMTKDSNKTSESLSTFNQSGMKKGYLETSGDYGKGTFKEGNEANKSYSNTFNDAKGATSPNKAGTQLDSNASMDINPAAVSSSLISKEGGNFNGTETPGNNAISKSTSLQSEMSTRTSNSIMSPVNDGIISKQSVIFGYFKI
jgi:hypothetical protein